MQAWSVTLFEDSKKTMASLAMQVGAAVGCFLSYNVFVIVNSKDWINQNLLDDAHEIDHSLISKKQWLWGLSVYCLFTIGIIHTFVSENVEKIPTATSIKIVLKIFGSILSKRMTKKWLYLCLVKYFAMYGFLRVWDPVMIRNGVPKET